MQQQIQTGSGETFRVALFRSCFLGLLLLLSVLQGSRAAPYTSLRTLTTARAAHDLTAQEALRAYPVHLRAVVTYYDPFIDPRQVIVFIHDATGSIFFALKHPVEGLSAGSLVDVTGVTGMGDFAPVLDRAQVKLIGKSTLPLAPPRSLAHLLTGQEDGQWIEVEGVVHSVYVTEHTASLQIATQDGLVGAAAPREANAEYEHLVDAEVKIHANQGPQFNGDGQMIGVRLLFPGFSAITIVEPGPENAFDLPLRSISGLLRFTPSVALPRRVHVRGQVTLNWPGSLVCLRDEEHGLCAHTSEETPLHLGEMADAVGFIEADGAVPALSDATIRKSDVAPEQTNLVSRPVTPEEALNGKNSSELVTLEGELIGRNLAAADTTLMLASRGFVYSVVLPKAQSGPASNAWKQGSRLRVTGICSVQLDTQRSDREGGAAIRKSFRIFLRSPGDVEVLQEPSWWTPAHTAVVLAVALSVVWLVLCWVVILTRRLRRQKQVIQDSEEQFRYMAQHDALTGLPTRGLLHQRLDEAFEQAKTSGTHLAVLMMDLDNFKFINDSLGHSAGDQALKTAAQRLSAAVRHTDMVARISGDEFVVLLDGLHDARYAEIIAASVVVALSASFRVGGKKVPLSASVGVCVASGREDSAETLLKCVDIAMYHAKAKGRNCFQLYTADMARSANRILKLRSELQNAISSSELEVHYQPLVSFQTGELTGFEALLRWRSKELGLVMPDEFISVAENSGLIVSIGEWVLRQACREIGALERQTSQSFLLAVNLSPRQIQQQDLIGDVQRILVEENRSPSQLEFEITESVLMQESIVAHASLVQLRNLGLRLAIDDFGVGFSSLSYITRFSIDRIKIDKSFIRKCMQEDSSLAVVRAMVAMAHGLSMTVVAEGIETSAEFHFLKNERCDFAQGFYFSRPVPFRELSFLIGHIAELGRPSKPSIDARHGASRPAYEAIPQLT